jgi:hypothetical protein
MRDIFDFERAANIVAPEGYELQDGSKLTLRRGINDEIIIDYDGVLKKKEPKERRESIYKRLLHDMKVKLDEARRENAHLKIEVETFKEKYMERFKVADKVMKLLERYKEVDPEIQAFLNF